jgi:hypothetical protein
MATDKNYKIPKDQIKELVSGYRAGLATDKIMVLGELVDYMYREDPAHAADSGWRFFSGSEDQAYVDDSNNMAFYAMNTLANYDPAIIPYLDLPIGTELERAPGTDLFRIMPE